MNYRETVQKLTELLLTTDHRWELYHTPSVESAQFTVTNCRNQQITILGINSNHIKWVSMELNNCRTYSNVDTFLSEVEF